MAVHRGHQRRLVLAVRDGRGPRLHLEPAARAERTGPAAATAAASTGGRTTTRARQAGADARVLTNDGMRDHALRMHRVVDEPDAYSRAAETLAPFFARWKARHKELQALREGLYADLYAEKEARAMNERLAEQRDGRRNSMGKTLKGSGSQDR